MKLSPLSLGTLHFIGIGGIGMSGLAEIFHNLGQTVQGSDISENANIQRLRKNGIPIFITQTASNLDNANIIVISSAIKKDNPEYKEALKLHMPIIHRSDLLAQLLRLKWSIAVSGSHGKTTITSLMAHLFETANLHPTVINGGIMNSYGSNACLGKGDWIIAEADESDGSFTKFFPTIGIVSNLDEEHMDHYATFDKLKEAFLTFLHNIPFFGFALMGYDDPDVRSLIPKLKNYKVITYGLHKEAQVRAINIVHTPEGMCFDALIKDISSTSFIRIENIQLKMLGKHNVQNSLSIIGLAIRIGLSESLIRKALSTFEGVKRRLTLLGNVNNAPVYDDYAHHPKEIEAILKTLTSLKDQDPNKRIIVVFQPHKYSRLAHLFKDFAQAFKLANQTYILPVYAAGEKPIKNINHKSLANAICSLPYSYKTTAIAIEKDEDLFSHLKEDLSSKDILVFMGAGSITSIASDFVKLYQ